MKWPDATNLGTALMKYLHQDDPERLFEDPYVSWFLHPGMREQSDDMRSPRLVDTCAEPVAPEGMFFRIAYAYTVLRERYFDDHIVHAVSNGCDRVVLLGAGYDTRALRLAPLTHNVRIFELDTSQTIERKIDIIKSHLGTIPENIKHLSVDFNTRDLVDLLGEVISPGSRAAVIWQGVSYYLPLETVESVLRAIAGTLPSESVFGFDSCTPLMLTPNDIIPGIEANITRLKEIGEPYIFGMKMPEMSEWLGSLGFHEVRIHSQDEIEARYLGRSCLPGNMWYCVLANRGNRNNHRIGGGKKILRFSLPESRLRN